MTAKEFITDYRNSTEKESLNDLISFKPTLKENITTDANFDFRKEVVKSLLNDFALADIILIRKLFTEEVICEKTTSRHDNLYQLAFYLFNLGQIVDTFILYDAKFNAKSIDAGTMLDRTSITVGHEIEDVISYVQKEFEKSAALKQKYPQILYELKSLQENPDYDNIADYTNFINGYFYGHKKTVSERENENPTEINFKPWWKFW
jgi:hypothetical protein